MHATSDKMSKNVLGCIYRGPVRQLQGSLAARLVGRFHRIAYARTRGMIALESGRVGTFKDKS